MPRERKESLRRDERGFTLPEMLVTIAIIGILVAIAVIVWLGILEQRRVTAATNQLAADLRLAHTSATNQFTDWRVVLVPNRSGEDRPDYYLVRLAQPYDPDISGNTSPAIDPNTPPIPRTFPANVKVMTQNYSSPALAGVAIQDNKAGGYYLSPDATISESTRTLEFNSDGAMTGYGYPYMSPSGTVRVTIDDEPAGEIRYLAATSRIKILP